MISRFFTVFLAVFSAHIHAAGFELIERDAVGLGTAYAGVAAIQSPAAVGWNPAAVPDRTELAGSAHYVDFEIEPYGAGESGVIPSLYGSHDGYGAGVYAPFGLGTSYRPGWQGEQRALRSQIRSVRLQASGGLEVAPSFRLGAGVFLQRLDAVLTNSLSRIEAGDTGAGFSLGALWQPGSLSLGLSFSSAVSHDLKGRATVTGNETFARTNIKTPESVRLGAAWRAAPDWLVLAGATWTRWSRIQVLTIETGLGFDLQEEHRWRDTWRVSLGTEHQRGRWTLRAGTAWDQTPIRSSAHRSPRMPDADRLWLSAGVGYGVRNGWRFDAGLTHIIYSASRSELPAISYDLSTQVFALGISRSW